MNRTALLVSCAAVLVLAACGGKSKADEDADADATTPDVPDDDMGDEDPPDDGEPGDPAADEQEEAEADMSGDAHGDTADEPVLPSLYFRNIRCLPDVDAGEEVVEGQSMTCRFEVHGEAGREVTLSCEDDAGSAIDCSSSSSTQIQPFGSNPLPVTDGWFGTFTNGLAGTSIVIVWVADDPMETAVHLFEADVVADDGVNEPPSIEVDCEGDTDGDVDVAAGDRLECTLLILDPDPDSVEWDYSQTSGPAPATSPSPYGGLGTAPYEVEWRWQTDSSDSGTFVYTFSVDDGTAAVVTFDLTVNVS